MRLYFIAFILLCLSQWTFATEETSQSTLLAIYHTETQTLSIPKLGVPSGDAGYAYEVEMKLYSNEPLGFIVTSFSQPTVIAAEEEISAAYRSESRSIFFPRVYIIDGENNISELRNVSLAITGDPFVWFYQAE